MTIHTTPVVSKKVHDGPRIKDSELAEFQKIAPIWSESAGRFGRIKIEYHRNDISRAGKVNIFVIGPSKRKMSTTFMYGGPVEVFQEGNQFVIRDKKG